MTYTIENDILSAAIKSLGSELTSIKIKKNGEQALWQGNPEIWQGQAPILFPVVGQVLNDTYLYNGIEYTMPKHGFARRHEFELVDHNTNSVTLVLKSNPKTKRMYPFDFELFVSYILKENELTVVNTIKNTGDKMYFSIGAHPGFICEIGDKLIFEQIENAYARYIDSEGIVTDKKELILNNSNEIIITKDIFLNDALIFKDLASKYVTLKTKNTTIKMTLGNAPYLGIWAKPGAPYVCIEPWFGIADSYNNNGDIMKKSGIVPLPSGAEYVFSYQIILIPN